MDSGSTALQRGWQSQRVPHLQGSSNNEAHSVVAQMAPDTKTQTHATRVGRAHLVRGRDDGWLDSPGAAGGQTHGAPVPGTWGVAGFATTGTTSTPRVGLHSRRHAVEL